jgi:hypothetical protein
MYKCPLCQMEVPDYMYHACGTTTVLDYTEVLDRIAKSLERIASKLEASQ